MAKQKSSNDNRSNVKNPNNPAYQHNNNNHSNQLNPNNPVYQPPKNNTAPPKKKE